MTIAAPRITVSKLLAVAAVVVASTTVATAATRAGAASAAVQRVSIAYTTHDHRARHAVVLLPADYRPGRNAPLPLVISPHGRSATGLSNSRFWGNLPNAGHFAVVCPDGMGRRLKWFSYGYSGQIDDLARMPEIVERALPWVHVDRSRVYAVGSSMGGQETLLLVARHPEILAGAVAMDSVTDLALRYRQVTGLPTSPEFAARWGAPKSVCVQRAMRREVGGTPATAPHGYAARSPLDQAPAIAASGVPLEIWWSRNDQIVTHQELQSGALYRKLRGMHTAAPVTERVGDWAHSTEMRYDQLLPLALRDLGLLPQA